MQELLDSHGLGLSIGPENSQRFLDAAHMNWLNNTYSLLEEEYARRD